MAKRKKGPAARKIAGATGADVAPDRLKDHADEISASGSSAVAEPPESVAAAESTATRAIGAAKTGDARPRMNTASPRTRVRTRAYYLYLARGAAHGHDLDDWLQAERELLTRAERELMAEDEHELVGQD